MMPNPKPLQSVRAFLGEGTIVQTYPGRIENTKLLQSEGRVPWIGFEECKVFIGEFPNRFRKLAVAEPEVRVGKVVQSGGQRPAS